MLVLSVNANMPMKPEFNEIAISYGDWAAASDPGFLYGSTYLKN